MAEETTNETDRRYGQWNYGIFMMQRRNRQEER